MAQPKNIKITVQYDGTDFAGWQTQPNKCSVQDSLEAALTKILGEPIKIIGSGRTDAGVHARGQTAGFQTNSEIDVSQLIRCANAVLPETITIIQAEEVKPEFNPRRWAKQRAYAYYIWNEPYASPFYNRYSWWISRPLNIALISQAAEFLVGTHDFAAFTPEKEKNTIRNISIFKVDISPDFTGRMIRLRIEADSFLYHLVRMMVGTLVEVGRGKMQTAQVANILAAKDIGRAGPRAPAKGLFLEKVYY